MNVDAAFKRIGLDRDYSGLNFRDLEPDYQGWRSDSPLFERAFKMVKPSLVFEVGTWKGASIFHMAGLAASMQLDTKFVCIDTWLGSNDSLWIKEDFRKSLMLVGGYPTMFRQFIRNLHEKKLEDRVYPLPMTSSAAYYLLKRLKLTPDIVHIDAGHEEDEVAIDLKLYYDILRPGGIIVGDDYHESWPGVIAAVNRFAADNRLMLTASGGKFIVQKPVEKAEP